MHEVPDAMLLEQGRDAAARGDCLLAHQLFAEADARGLLCGPDLALLADSAYAAGHLDVTIEAWERAHAECMQAGDHLAAAGAAVRVAHAPALRHRADGAGPRLGARAERLLEGQDETPVHAWLAVVRTYERMLTGDSRARSAVGPASHRGGCEL